MQCVFCHKWQKHCWSYFAISQIQLLNWSYDKDDMLGLAYRPCNVT